MENEIQKCEQCGKEKSSTQPFEGPLCWNCAGHDSPTECKLANQLAAAVALLDEWTGWNPGVGILPPVKIQHGLCCCCGTCGHYHDDCVCDHNEIEAALAAVGALKAGAL